MTEKEITYLQTCCSEQNFGDIFDILRKQEIDSLRSGHFAQAEEAKIRFNRLKEEQARIRQEMLQAKNKQNVRELEKQGQADIQHFQDKWQVSLRAHIDEAKRQQENLQRQHDKELDDFSEKLMAEEIPRVKFGPNVLSLRKNLQNQIKIRNYKEAEITTTTLMVAEEEEACHWRQKWEEKKKHRYEHLVKKQQLEFKALRIKLETQFNEKIKEREIKFHILLKKNQKRKIQQAKLNQTCALELSRDLSRTLSTINRPLNLNRCNSRSSEKKIRSNLKTWVN